MPVTVYHYPACDTCRRALRWLDARGLEVKRVHIVETPPTRQALEAMWVRSELPLKKLFNTASRTHA